MSVFHKLISILNVIPQILIEFLFWNVTKRFCSLPGRPIKHKKIQTKKGEHVPLDVPISHKIAVVTVSGARSSVRRQKEANIRAAFRL